MKKVLVIGGGYFAGRVFVEEFLAGKHGTLHTFNRGNRPLGFECVFEHRGDRDNGDTIATAIPPDTWDAVVDFCAYSPEQIETLFDNIRGSIKHYLLISSTSVYQVTSRLPVTENAALLSGPQPELGRFADYGYDKVRAENTAAECCGRSGIPLTILRPAIIYGFYDYSDRESYFFDAALSGKVLYIPEKSLAMYSFIWVVDLAKILLSCIGEKRVFGEIYNVAGPELISYDSIVETLGSLCPNPLDIERWPMNVLQRVGVRLPYPPDQHLLYDGNKIQSALGHEMTSFSEGVKMSFEYYCSVHSQSKK